MFTPQTSPGTYYVLAKRCMSPFSARTYHVNVLLHRCCAVQIDSRRKSGRGAVMRPFWIWFIGSGEGWVLSSFQIFLLKACKNAFKQGFLVQIHLVGNFTYCKSSFNPQGDFWVGLFSKPRVWCRIQFHSKWYLFFSMDLAYLDKICNINMPFLGMAQPVCTTKNRASVGV